MLKDFLMKSGLIFFHPMVLPSPSIVPMSLATCHSYPIIVTISDILEILSRNLEGFCVVQLQACVNSNDVLMQNLTSCHHISFLDYLGNGLYDTNLNTHPQMLPGPFVPTFYSVLLEAFSNPTPVFLFFGGKLSKAFKIVSKIRII